MNKSPVKYFVLDCAYYLKILRYVVYKSNTYICFHDNTHVL